MQAPERARSAGARAQHCVQRQLALREAGANELGGPQGKNVCITQIRQTVKCIGHPRSRSLAVHAGQVESACELSHPCMASSRTHGLRSKRRTPLPHPAPTLAVLVLLTGAQASPPPGLVRLQGSEQPCGKVRRGRMVAPPAAAAATAYGSTSKVIRRRPKLGLRQRMHACPIGLHDSLGPLSSSSSALHSRHALHSPCCVASRVLPSWYRNYLALKTSKGLSRARRRHAERRKSLQL